MFPKVSKMAIPFHTWYICKVQAHRLRIAAAVNQEYGNIRPCPIQRLPEVVPVTGICPGGICGRGERTTRIAKIRLVNFDHLLVGNDGPYSVHNRVVVHIKSQNERRRHDCPGAEVSSLFHLAQPWIFRITANANSHFEHVGISPTPRKAQVSCRESCNLVQVIEDTFETRLDVVRCAVKVPRAPVTSWFIMYHRLRHATWLLAAPMTVLNDHRRAAILFENLCPEIHVQLHATSIQFIPIKTEIS
mmetsp:Transcript_97587/g.154393  ORF Transcript_97587/g.154393 Transcript_97587/m.154393 type:complete len:246 (-) Transcript_97587:530-1267(-)